MRQYLFTLVAIAYLSFVLEHSICELCRVHSWQILSVSPEPALVCFTFTPVREPLTTMGNNSVLNGNDGRRDA